MIATGPWSLSPGDPAGPAHVDAWHNLGVLLGEEGRLEEALTNLRQAVALDPADAISHSSLLFLLNYPAGSVVRRPVPVTSGLGKRHADVSGGRIHRWWRRPPAAGGLCFPGLEKAPRRVLHGNRC